MRRDILGPAMSNPTVCCVCLTRDRPEMTARAVRCFREQAYDPVMRRLLIVDGGNPSWYDPASDAENEVQVYCDSTGLFPGNYKGGTIGSLRNYANSMAGTDIIAHWDSDDLSSPQRLTEQVVLLESSGADAVGFNQALFWDTTTLYGPQAWLYTSPKADVALGGTLCYWRRTWEAKRFQDVKHGEDTLWQTGMRVAAVSGIAWDHPVEGLNVPAPRFIAHIHGSNTSSVITPTVRDWRRVPAWDDHCRKVMQL